MDLEAITFPSADGSCRGVLYMPDDVPGPPAVVVFSHGFSGTRLTGYDRRARQLLAAGVAVLDFDPRAVGTSPGGPRQRIDAFDWLDDLRAAVAYARSRPDVDAARIGLYGSSMGGGLALEVAAEDGGIAALAVDVPALDGLRLTPAPLRTRPALAAAIVRDAVGRRRGRPAAPPAGLRRAALGRRAPARRLRLLACDRGARGRRVAGTGSGRPPPAHR